MHGHERSEVVRSFSQAEDSVVSTARLSGEERNDKSMHISRLFAILFLLAAGSLTGCFTDNSTNTTATATFGNPCVTPPPLPTP